MTREDKSSRWANESPINEAGSDGMATASSRSRGGAYRAVSPPTLPTRPSLMLAATPFWDTLLWAMSLPHRITNRGSSRPPKGIPSHFRRWSFVGNRRLQRLREAGGRQSSRPRRTIRAPESLTLPLVTPRSDGRWSRRSGPRNQSRSPLPHRRSCAARRSGRSRDRTQDRAFRD